MSTNTWVQSHRDIALIITQKSAPIPRTRAVRYAQSLHQRRRHYVCVHGVPRNRRPQRAIETSHRLLERVERRARRPIEFDEETYKSGYHGGPELVLGIYDAGEEVGPPCFSYDGTKSLKDTLELYFQICSILSTSKAMSIMAATLANGGLNPISGCRVCTPDVYDAHCH